MANLMKIVLVDDEKANLDFLEQVLQDHQTFSFQDAKKALAYCTANQVDLVLTDMRMPGMTGLALIQEIKKKKNDFMAVVISAFKDSEYLMEAVNTNVLFQYLLKPCEPAQIQETVNQALRKLQKDRQALAERSRLTEENQKLIQENTQLRFNANSPLESIVGSNPTIMKVREQIKSFSLSDHPILISGEPGTGKKLVAQVIHEMSGRREGSYVALNCASIPMEMLEAEIFGAVKSPTQKDDRSGLLAQAADGTLLLENVELLPKTTQTRLLKYLQYGTYYPIGSTEEKSLDVRVICSSSSNLLKEVEDGVIRKELFYKISNLHIKTPPLRDRREDIQVILEVLASRSGKSLPTLDSKGKDALYRYTYPGNIRELQGILEKIQLVAKGTKNNSAPTEEVDRILKENSLIYSGNETSRSVVQTVQLPTAGEIISLKKFVGGIEKEIIMTCLKACDYNISQTARSLQISRQGLKNKIKRYKLPVTFNDDD